MLLVQSKPSSLIRETMFPGSFQSLIRSVFNESDSSTVPFNFMPAADVVEHPESFEIRIAIPGLKKDEIKVHVEGELLTIEGERKQEKATENSKFLKTEISYGKFSRTFQVGDTDTSAVEASFENGMLLINLPKKKEERATEIKIK